MAQISASAGGHSPAARAVAAHGLVGTTLNLPEAPLTDVEFTRLHAATRSQRMTGLFWAAITSGAFPVTSSQRDRAEESHLQSLAAALVLEHLVVNTVGVLEKAAIPVRTLKGVALAHLDYPDPGLRTFGDIDLLVPGDQFDDAVTVITETGAARRYPQPRPGFDRRFSKGTCLCTPDGLEIDLHRTFTMGPFGARLALHELWARCDEFDLAGVTVQALSVEERLLHAAYHAALGDERPRLVPLRDVAQILLTHDVDMSRLHWLMRASQGEAVVARAVRWAWQELQIADVLGASAWAETYREDQRTLSDLAVYGLGSSYAARSWATVKAIPTLSQRLKFVYAMTMPQRSYLGTRHRSQRDRLRQGIGEIRSLRSQR
ncbi:MAG TPA: nucleotidyltransferase family protein [Nocardioidaceae bacterium]|nr:nucleotidyltransferase family protein [Nocardioidaceae bacterium]